jgi:hypothetical protein
VSSEKEKIVEIEETDLTKVENIENILWILDEFAEFNLMKCITIQQLLNLNLQVKIEENLLVLKGDHFSCSIRVEGLINGDDEMIKVFENYIKKRLLAYAKFRGW